MRETHIVNAAPRHAAFRSAKDLAKPV